LLFRGSAPGHALFQRTGVECVAFYDLTAIPWLSGAPFSPGDYRLAN
jgi:hypothetical protein